MTDISLLDEVSEARWEGSQLVNGHSGRPGSIVRLEVDGPAEQAPNGAVTVGNKRMEDGNVHRVLATHPKWVSAGTIKGWFPWQELPERPIFRSRVGFAEGATSSDGVRFQLWAHVIDSGREVWSRLASVTKRPTNRLADFDVDLTHLGGQRVQLELRVDTGDEPPFRTVHSSSGQDWAAWVEPRIENDPSLPEASVWNFGPSRLAIRDETERNGDDPYMAGVYFRTRVGVVGSTRVVPLDELREIGEDLDTGTSRAVRSPRINDVVSVVPFSNDLTGMTILGMVLAPIEEDMDNRGQVRPIVRTLACQLRVAIRRSMERTGAWSPLRVGLAVNGIRAQQTNGTLPPCDMPVVSDGNLSAIDAIRGLFVSPDDRLSEIAAFGWGLNQGDFRRFNAALGGALNRSESAGHLPIANDSVSLTTHGDGGIWDATVSLRPVRSTTRLTVDM